MTWTDLFKKASSAAATVAAQPPRARPSPQTRGMDDDALPDPNAIDLVACPLFMDRAAGKTATGGTVVVLHAVPGRSYVAGQRMLDVNTPIGVLPVRAKTNGFLVSFVVQPGSEVAEGKPLWRTRVSKPM